jgi:hypothetical protein
MTAQIPLRCRGGAVRGAANDISPQTGSHIVCYCDDCQAYCRFLGRDDIVDTHGGTRIFQLAPAQVIISQGQEQLVCMRLSDKGMIRWYTQCCRTPVGNTMPMPGLPFVGIVAVFMDFGDDGGARDAVLGKPIARVMGKYARGGAAPDTHPNIPASLLLRSVYLLARARLAGKHRPSVFFDVEAKRPRVPPQVLGAPERAALG